MNVTGAGGRNAHTQPSPGIGSLETDLQNVADAVAALLVEARAIDPGRDEFGHARSRAYSDAVALLKASAKVGHTIAELRGSKFEHNINVRQQDAGDAWHSAHRIARRGAADTDEEEAENEWDHYQGSRYDGTFQFADGTYFVHGRGRIHIPENWDEERWRAGLPQKGEQGDPPGISGGSNGNFE